MESIEDRLVDRNETAFYSYPSFQPIPHRTCVFNGEIKGGKLRFPRVNAVCSRFVSGVKRLLFFFNWLTYPFNEVLADSGRYPLARVYGGVDPQVLLVLTRRPNLYQWKQLNISHEAEQGRR